MKNVYICNITTSSCVIGAYKGNVNEIVWNCMFRVETTFGYVIVRYYIIMSIPNGIHLFSCRYERCLRLKLVDRNIVRTHTWRCIDVFTRSQNVSRIIMIVIKRVLTDAVLPAFKSVPTYYASLTSINLFVIIIGCRVACNYPDIIIILTVEIIIMYRRFV